jgi:hypothetical protein
MHGMLNDKMPLDLQAVKQTEFQENSAVLKCLEVLNEIEIKLAELKTVSIIKD